MDTNHTDTNTPDAITEQLRGDSESIERVADALKVLAVKRNALRREINDLQADLNEKRKIQRDTERLLKKYTACTLN